MPNIYINLYITWSSKFITNAGNIRFSPKFSIFNFIFLYKEFNINAYSAKKVIQLCVLFAFALGLDSQMCTCMKNKPRPRLLVTFLRHLKRK